MEFYAFEIYLHIIIAVDGRDSLIPFYFSQALQAHVTEILRKKGDRVIAISNEPDHMHVICKLKPAHSIEQVVTWIKDGSKELLHKEGVTRGNFAWQEGYIALSCSYNDLPKMTKYLQVQPSYHRLVPFEREHADILTEAEIEFDPADSFEFVDPVLLEPYRA